MVRLARMVILSLEKGAMIIMKFMDPFLVQIWVKVMAIAYSPYTSPFGPYGSTLQSPTGCIASALGMIIKYHQFPTTFP
jgi:hypothetical protein